MNVQVSLLLAESNILTYTITGAVIGAGVGLVWGIISAFRKPPSDD